MGFQLCYIVGFQHTAARRRLVNSISPRFPPEKVSTHSRPKAAGLLHPNKPYRLAEFQHTAARRRLALVNTVTPSSSKVSTHSRPKAAGAKNGMPFNPYKVSTHSRPKAAGNASKRDKTLQTWFQHTAARRRLGHV